VALRAKALHLVQGHYANIRQVPRWSAIVQARMRRLKHRRGKTRKDASAAAAVFSDHSLRASYATSAGCQGAAELPHSGAHSPEIGGYGAALHPRKRPVGKEWVE
jgi:hypothetical protein